MSGGFPTGDGRFNMGYVRDPTKTPGTFTNDDYVQMSSGLSKVGLKCKDNTPEKMKEYVADVAESLPKPGEKELTVYMSAREGEHKEFEFVLDPTNVNFSKMSVLLEHLQEIHDTGAYYVGSNSTSSSFESSTIGSIKDAFKAVGSIISDVQSGKVDPGQIVNTIGDALSSLTETTSKTFDRHVSKVLFCIAKPDTTKGTAAAICGMKYEYTMHVEDITNKKEKSHKAKYSMKQSNLVFTDPDIFEKVYEKIAGSKSAQEQNEL